jgi:putative endonuclease
MGKMTRIKKDNAAKQKDKWRVYILECSDGTYYTGITNNLSRRLQQHNDGTASKYTRGQRPVKLRGSRICPDKSSALKMEYAIKRLPRGEKLKLLKSVSYRTGKFNHSP